MTLFPCQECKSKISLSAKFCPQCGSISPFLEQHLLTEFDVCNKQIEENLPQENFLKNELKNISNHIFHSLLVGLLIILFYGFIIESLIEYFNFSNTTKYIVFLYITTSIYIGISGLLIYLNQSWREELSFKNFLFDINKIIDENFHQKKILIQSTTKRLALLAKLIPKDKLKKQNISSIRSSLEEYKNKTNSTVSKKTIFLLYLYEIFIKSIIYSFFIASIFFVSLLIFYYINDFSHNHVEISDNIEKITLNSDYINLIKSIWQDFFSDTDMSFFEIINENYIKIQDYLFKNISHFDFIYTPIILSLNLIIMFIGFFISIEFWRYMFGRRIKYHIEKISYYDFIDSYKALIDINTEIKENRGVKPRLSKK